MQGYDNGDAEPPPSVATCLVPVEGVLNAARLTAMTPALASTDAIPSACFHREGVREPVVGSLVMADRKWICHGMWQSFFVCAPLPPNFLQLLLIFHHHCH